MTNPTFTTRQRREMGRALIAYGDDLARVLRVMEEHCRIIDADRELY